MTGASGGSTDMLTGWPDPKPDPNSEAVAYQIDSAHSGMQPNDTLTLPLTVQWKTDFDGATDISYPVVASGKVFVTIKNGQSTSLVALNEATGSTLWGPTTLGGSPFAFSAIAYELGRLFTVNHDGVMQAFDAATGSVLWTTQLPGQYAFSAPPTAFGRRVYVGGAGSGGTLYAVNGANGSVLWTAEVENGDNSSPVAVPGGVFVGYACNQDYGFALDSGAALWHHSTGCEGGGGKTLSLIGSDLFGRDDGTGNVVLDSKSGALLGTFASRTIPAGSAAAIYTVVSSQSGVLPGGPVTAIQFGNPTPLWSFGSAVTSAPIAIGNSFVVVGQDRNVGSAVTGEVDVLDAHTGKLLSSAGVAEEIPQPNEFGGGSSLTGFAVADNHLFVPTGTWLYCF